MVSLSLSNNQSGNPGGYGVTTGRDTDSVQRLDKGMIRVLGGMELDNTNSITLCRTAHNLKLAFLFLEFSILYFQTEADCG